jgi:hypothetical protein
MTRRRLVALFAVLAGAVALAAAPSGPAAIYAIVDKVVMEPDEKAPERIQVWGVFSTWNVTTSSYSQPARGYMYFALPGPEVTQWRAGGTRPSAPIARIEWADLKRVAGSTSGVAFGERGYWQGRLRKAGEPPASPDAYPIYNGITQLSHLDDVGPEIILRLREAATRR